jgi:hypothetical protein
MLQAIVYNEPKSSELALTLTELMIEPSYTRKLILSLFVFESIFNRAKSIVNL